MANKYLIHNYHSPNPAEKFLTLFLDDKVFNMYPGEPMEIESDSNGRRLDNPDFYAHHIVSIYGSVYGIVEVPVTRTRSGMTFDIDKAIELADATLLQNRHRLINLWASDQLQSRVRANLPVLPPTGFVAESIIELNMDVQKRFGFRPIGWDYNPREDQPPMVDFVDPLKLENDDLKARMARLEEALGLNAATPIPDFNGPTSGTPEPKPTTKPKER